MVMNHSSRSRSASLSYLTFLVAALCAASALSAATWPSGACPGTLQACIDAAAAGEAIEIATNGPINESPQVNDKSLTLRPAAGFAPVFSSPNSIFVIGGDVAATNVVEGMTIANGRLVAIQGGEGAFDVTFRANVILDTYSYGAAVEIRSGNTQPPYGPVAFDVSDNRITVDGFSAGDQIGAISVGSFESDGSGRIAGNVIVQTGESTQNAVIGAYSGAHALTVDILANDIGGQGFNNGISLFQFAPGGSITARVVNNLVRGGQIDVAGQPGGIGLNVSQGSGVFTVVNNTIANGESGISVSARLDLGATLSGVLANNIVAGHSDYGMGIEEDLAGSFANHHNLVFGNASDYFTPGPGTLTADPQFAGGNDYHLQSSSPARQAGDDAAVPADITGDLDGAPRIQGPAVDLGAYEDAISAAEIPALGPLGLALLAGGLGAAALATSRRRR
jgi:hypothetical protein